MAHERKITDTFIGLKLNEGKHTLFVINTREVMGHDDSLPYNANFEIRKDNEIVASGKAWNDGWGGETNIDLDDLKQQKEVDEINKYIEEHLHFYFNGYAYDIDFIMLVDNLAFLSIENPKNNGHIFPETAMVKYLESR